VLDQYGAGLFEQQQFGTAGVKWVNSPDLSGPAKSCTGAQYRALGVPDPRLLGPVTDL